MIQRDKMIQVGSSSTITDIFLYKICRLYLGTQSESHRRPVRGACDARPVREVRTAPASARSPAQCMKEEAARRFMVQRGMLHDSRVH